MCIHKPKNKAAKLIFKLVENFKPNTQAPRKLLNFMKAYHTLQHLIPHV